VLHTKTSRLDDLAQPRKLQVPSSLSYRHCLAMLTGRRLRSQEGGICKLDPADSKSFDVGGGAKASLGRGPNLTKPCWVQDLNSGRGEES
jgi:hypothetical protein